ncbi:MAG: D-alanyl-D-alanine carboxypeptidase [Oscillospiraceae bacterium]|nr:D-alanyl-D-alanine carboxypeptidase [Oscillospiraceae bacterium]
MKKLIILFIIGCFALLCISPVYAVPAEKKPFEVSAKSAILINMDTGAVIFEKNSLERRAMASTTKIMTALLTLESGNLDTQFTVDPYAIRVEGSSMGLREGDIVTKKILAAGMLLPSGNDAAQAGAVCVAGSLPEFVKRMNERAALLNLSDTHFANPSGLDANGHYSTAYDLALLTIEALQNKEFTELCGLQEQRVEFGNPPFGRWLYNNNRLLYMYNSTIGVKTGFTDNAGRCLVTAARKNGVTLIAVTLGAPNDWQDHMNMYDYGFSVVKNQIVDYDVSKLFVNVAGGEKETAAVKFAEMPSIPLSDAEMRLVDIKTSIMPFIYAGFEEGEQVGILQFYYNGKLLKTVSLVTAEACASPGEKLSVSASFVQFWRRTLF